MVGVSTVVPNGIDRLDTWMHILWIHMGIRFKQMGRPAIWFRLLCAPLSVISLPMTLRHSKNGHFSCVGTWLPRKIDKQSAWECPNWWLIIMCPIDRATITCTNLSQHFTTCHDFSLSLRAYFSYKAIDLIFGENYYSIFPNKTPKTPKALHWDSNRTKRTIPTSPMVKPQRANHEFQTCFYPSIQTDPLPSRHRDTPEYSRVKTKITYPSIINMAMDLSRFIVNCPSYKPRFGVS